MPQLLHKPSMELMQSLYYRMVAGKVFYLGIPDTPEMVSNPNQQPVIMVCDNFPSPKDVKGCHERFRAGDHPYGHVGRARACPESETNLNRIR